MPSCRPPRLAAGGPAAGASVLVRSGAIYSAYRWCVAMYRSTAGGTLPPIERPPWMSLRMGLADTSGVRAGQTVTPWPSSPPPPGSAASGARGGRWEGDGASPPTLRRVHPSSSRVVFELDPADADRVPRLDPGPLQGLVDAEAVELGLETFERTLGIEVGVRDQVLDAIALHLEPPGLAFDDEIGDGYRQLDRRRTGRSPGFRCGRDL